MMIHSDLQNEFTVDDHACHQNIFLLVNHLPHYPWSTHTCCIVSKFCFASKTPYISSNPHATLREQSQIKSICRTLFFLLCCIESLATQVNQWLKYENRGFSLSSGVYIAWQFFFFFCSEQWCRCDCQPKKIS